MPIPLQSMGAGVGCVEDLTPGTCPLPPPPPPILITFNPPLQDIAILLAIHMIQYLL